MLSGLEPSLENGSSICALKWVIISEPYRCMVVPPTWRILAFPPRCLYHFYHATEQTTPKFSSLRKKNGSLLMRLESIVELDGFVDLGWLRWSPAGLNHKAGVNQLEVHWSRIVSQVWYLTDSHCGDKGDWALCRSPSSSIGQAGPNGGVKCPRQNRDTHSLLIASLKTDMISFPLHSIAQSKS